MALLPPFFLDTIVAIGVGNDPKNRRWIGTGFIYGKLQTEKKYQLWLITNKHVLKGIREIFIKFNSAQDPNSKDYKVSLIARNGRTRWVGHSDKNIDVAAIFLSASFLKAEARRFAYFKSDTHIMTNDQMKSNGITEGDRIFVLGFPMGLVSPERQYVICRGGHIARVRDFLEGKAKSYLVDVLVFPGNSGGPVIICPSNLAIRGTKTIERADLVGIVKEYVSYTDVAISQQTRRPRIIFEENSGLAVVESVDSIMETVELANKRLKGRAAQAKHKSKKLKGETDTRKT